MIQEEESQPFRYQSITNVSVCAGFNSPSQMFAPGKSSERVIHNSVLFTAEGVPSKEIEKMATGGVGECPSHSFILEISN